MVLLENSVTFSIKSRLSGEDQLESPEATVTVSLGQLRLSNHSGSEENDTSVSPRDEKCVPMPSSHHHYTPVCTIGTGTFGRVYLAEQNSTSKFFALKVMKMREIIRTKQVQHVHNEKKILEKVDHPFIVKLLNSWKEAGCLHLLFAYVPGGELFSHLRARGHFSAPIAKFYAAEILLALDYLHNRHIIYRDLKPENLLLERDGHLILTDFGFAKELRDRTWTLCGTPEYLAPEVVECRGHNKAVDYWAFGVLIYEMLAGYAPFSGSNPLQIYEKIIEGKPKYPAHFDLCAKDLTRKLLVYDRTKRFGNMKVKYESDFDPVNSTPFQNGVEDVKNHKWFDGVDWILLTDRAISAPIIPRIAHAGDTGNFDKYEEEKIWQDEKNDLNANELREFCDW